MNDGAAQVLGDKTLRAIAQELVRAVRNNVTIDWTLRENVQAKMRVMVKRILRRYGYPPDKQEKATQTVLEQAEVLCFDFAFHSCPPTKLPSASLAQHLQKLCCCEDRNATCSLQDQKVLVASDNHVSLTNNGAGDHHVIVWIAADARDTRLLF